MEGGTEMENKMIDNNKEVSLEELEEMIENANKEGLLMCMTDAEVNDVTEG